MQPNSGEIMAVHGMSFHFSLPDDEDVVWGGNIQWNHHDGLAPCCEEFDSGWLVDYLAYSADDGTEQHAMLCLR
jgi:hypothetical protein